MYASQILYISDCADILRFMMKTMRLSLLRLWGENMSSTVHIGTIYLRVLRSSSNFLWLLIQLSDTLALMDLNINGMSPYILFD